MRSRRYSWRVSLPLRGDIARRANSAAWERFLYGKTPGAGPVQWRVRPAYGETVD